MLTFLIITNIVLCLIVAYLVLVLWVKNATIRELRGIANKWLMLFIDSKQQKDFAMWREEFDDLDR